MWIPLCQREIDSDLMVLHRVDPDALSLWDYLRRAEFLPSYEGAVRTRLRMEQNRLDAEPTPSTAKTSVPAAVPNVSGDDDVRALMDQARARRHPGHQITKVRPDKLFVSTGGGSGGG